MTGSDELLTLSNGRRLELWLGGDPDGTPVVFLPGCPDSRLAALWGHDAAVRQGVRLISVNRPGYGRSTPHHSNHVSVATDVAEALRQLALDRVAVLGMSFGGPYALALATRYTALVTGVGIVASPAEVPSLDPPAHRDGLPPAEQARLVDIGNADIDGAVALLEPEYQSWRRSVFADDPDDDTLTERWVAGPEADRVVLRRQPDAEIAAMAREAVATPDGYLRDAAAGLRRWAFRPEDVACPTWLWYGELDENASARNGAWLAQRIPGAVMQVRRGCGHLAALHDHWDEILSTLAGRRAQEPRRT